MPSVAQIELWPATKVAANTPLTTAPNGVRYAAWGETRLPESEAARLVGAVPALVAPAVQHRAYFFVPLAIGEDGATFAAPSFSVELSDRATCHRNATVPDAEAVFISTRLVEDRFGLAFEFFINVAHNFVESAGVPQSFADMVWSQAEAGVRGETSQDAWEARRRALDPAQALRDGEPVTTGNKIDERARLAYHEAAFSDAMAIYMLSLALDFDYHDLREREYPLLAPAALAERLRHVAALFPPNAGYEFSILYRRKA